MNEISPLQLKSFIAHLFELQTNRAPQDDMVSPLMIWGAPGVGKSSLVIDVAREFGVPVIDVRLSQREPVDMRGLPVPGDDAVRWLLSDEWPRDPESKGILFFDEITAADRSLQAAAYELILDRKLGANYTLPNGWLIVAAGNRSSDRAVSFAMSSALANRFCHVTLEAKLDDWIHWGRRADIHPLLLGFLRYRPQLLFKMDGSVEQGWPSPRSWQRVSTLLKSFEKRGTPVDALVDIAVAGLVGQGAAMEFAAFRKFQDCSNFAEMALLHNHEPRFPERSDARYAYTSGLVYHFLSHKAEASKLWTRFLQIVTAMSQDFGVLAVTDVLAALPPSVSGDLLSDPKYQEWARNSKVFSEPSPPPADFTMALPSNARGHELPLLDLDID